MFLAISEIAVAMSVCSVLEKPQPAASSRPFCRATTTSISRTIGTRCSAGIIRFPRFSPTLQDLEPLLEIERGRDALERQSELHHGERHLGLDTDDDGIGSAELGRVGDSADGPRGERV